MLTLKTILRATRLAASYGDNGVPVPRDHQPPEFYQRRRPLDGADEPKAAAPQHSTE